MIRTLAILSLFLLLAACSSGSDSNGDPSEGRYLVSITVLPVDPGLPAGRTQQFIAIGNYNDGFQFNITRFVTWSSSNPTVASVDSATGLVTTKSMGQAVISARLAVTGSTTVTVNGATLSRLVIIPADASDPAGTQRQFTALGEFSDGSTADVTSLATWNSSNTVVLDVVPSGTGAGLADFLAPGAVTLSASYLSTNTAVPVTVTAATLVELLIDPVVASVPSGLAVQYHATGIYSDGTSSPLTDEVAWSSSNSAIADIDVTGLARGLIPGNATIRADSPGFSATASLTVTAPVTVGLEILPPAVDAPAGTRGQLHLVAFKSDGTAVEATAEAIWRSSNITVAIIIPDGSNAGFGYLLAPGTATVTAAYDGQETSIPVTVTAALLVEILLQPVDAAIASGLDIQYQATGIYSDGRSEPLGDEVSWQSSNPAVATIDLAGLAHGVAPGVTTVTATFSGVSGNTSLTVSPAFVTALQILPAAIDVPAVTTGQLQALAFYSDGSTGDVTAEATWNSTDETVLHVVPAGADAGFASALSPGSATVSATFQGVSNRIPATVRPAVLTGIVVEPVVATVASGITVQYTATGLYSDGSSEPLGDEVGWQTSNPAVAVIDLDGLAQGVQPGVATITGSYGGFSDQATLTVTAAVVTRLQALPPTVTAPLGSTGQLQAVAFYSDGSIAEVTAESTWNSSDEGIVYVIADGGEAGQAAAKGVGAATVSASFSGQSSAMPVTVTAAVLTEIQVQPVDETLAKGLDEKFVATGIYSDGTSEPLGQEVAWQSSDPAIATVNTSGLAHAVDIGVATISASFGGLVGQADLTVTAATVTSVQVTPAVVDLPVGTRRQYTATAYYTDLTASNVTNVALWTSSAPNVLDVAPNGKGAGLATALAQGAATVLATFRGVTGTAQATVSPAVLLEVIVTPASKSIANGLTVQYAASGIYSDGSNVDLTNDAGWQSSNTAVAVISPQGLATAAGVGTTTIQATVGGLFSQASLDVTVAVVTGLQVQPGDFSIPAGRTQQLNSIAYYSDGSTAEVTDNSTWNSTDESVLFVASGDPLRGLAKARVVGTATVSAGFAGFTATVQATVTSAVLQSISIAPANASVASGVEIQYEATGIYSDGTSQRLTGQVAWQSSVTGVATIGTTGLADTVAPGATTITASLSGVTGQTPLNVTAAVVESLQITPASLVEPAGTSRQFTATAFYSDATSKDVTREATWSSSDSLVVTVGTTGEDSGFAQLLAPGNATITAAFQGVSDSTPIEVTPAVLVKIDIDPVAAVVPSGVPVQYQATGVFSDGSSSDISTDVSWQSSNTTVATVGLGGLALTGAPGVTTISATSGSVSSSVTLTVQNAVAVVLQILPGSVTLPLGKREQLQAIVLFSDLTTQDVTTLATWTSTNEAIVDVVAGGADAGLATMVGIGSAFVSSSYQGTNTSIPVEVTAAVLTSIEVDPVGESVPQGVSVQYHATGIYSDGTSTPLDEDVTWRSSDTTVATIDQDGLANTLGTGSQQSIGTTQISASYIGFSDETPLKVTTAIVTGLQITPTGLEKPAGTSGQLTATAFYTDLTSADVTNQATWSSSDTAVVSVGNSGENGGFAELLAPGVANVTALFEGVSDSNPITVTNAVLTSISVDPRVEDVPKGSEVQYSATGFFSDGSSSSTDDDVSWASNNLTVATIDLDGKAEAIGLGIAAITASLDGITGSATLNVSDAIVVALQVTPPLLTEPAGTSGQLTALALFSDGSDEDVTLEATWQSSDKAVVTVGTGSETSGFVQLIAKGTATITATYQGVDDVIPVEVTDAVLVDILIDPPSATRAAGLAVQYNATGVFSDGSLSTINDDVTWQSSDTAVAIITQNGEAVGKAVGTANITASLADITASTPLTITSAILTEIQVSPVVEELIVGLTTQYAATGVFSDGGTADLTGDVTWDTGSDMVADISNAAGSEGLLSALGVGVSTVTAALGGIIGGASLTVTPVAVTGVEIVPVNITVPVGISSEWVALAVFADGSTLDITEDATWFSNDNDIASVVKGVVTGVSEGNTDILINYQGVSDDQPVTVTAPNTETVTITPTWVKLDVGNLQQLTAIARFDDGTNAVVTEDANWLVDDNSVAQVDNTSGQKGLASAISPGIAAVTALLSDAAGGSAIEVVDLTLIDLTVTPAAKSIAANSSVFYTATGIYDDGSVQDLTNNVAWTSDDPSVAQIGNGVDDKGIATTLSAGSTLIRAVIESATRFETTASLQVTAACPNGNPDSVAIVPDPSTVSVGARTQLELIATFGACEQNVTNNSGANWKSNDPNTAAVTKNGGEVIGLDVGTAEIEGKYKGQAALADVNVIATEVARIRIDAAPSIILSPGTFTLQCLMQEIVGGVLQPEVVVTPLVAWTIDKPAVLLLSALIVDNQQFSTLSLGSAVIGCHYGGKRAEVSVTIQ